jgi:hypothetical protein
MVPDKFIMVPDPEHMILGSIKDSTYNFICMASTLGAKFSIAISSFSIWFDALCSPGLLDPVFTSDRTGGEGGLDV